MADARDDSADDEKTDLGLAEMLTGAVVVDEDGEADAAVGKGETGAVVVDVVVDDVVHVDAAVGAAAMTGVVLGYRPSTRPKPKHLEKPRPEKHGDCANPTWHGASLVSPRSQPPTVGETTRVKRLG